MFADKMGFRERCLEIIYQVMAGSMLTVGKPRRHPKRYLVARKDGEKYKNLTN